METNELLRLAHHPSQHITRPENSEREVLSALMVLPERFKVPAFIIDERRDIPAVNEAFLTFFGYSPREILELQADGQANMLWQVFAPEADFYKRFVEDGERGVARQRALAKGMLRVFRLQNALNLDAPWLKAFYAHLGEVSPQFDALRKELDAELSAGPFQHIHVSPLTDQEGRPIDVIAYHLSTGDFPFPQIVFYALPGNGPMIM